CDSIRIDGSTRDPFETRLSFANAQKMRAAVTWNYAQVDGQGNAPWRKSDATGKWVGNPSVSTLVSQYMSSLKRRKAHSGEVPMSARAITPGILEQLYDFNNDQGRSDPKPMGSVKSQRWDGARARLSTWNAYLFAFNCLLRVDEVLNMQAQDITKDSEDPEAIIVTLPFRKTHQYGNVEPFYLYPLPEEQAHLCPVRAYANWIGTCEIKTGYLFPKIGAGDRLATDKNEPMVSLCCLCLGKGWKLTGKPQSSAEFLEMFRNHLLDINVDPYPYGTHSFRRGGCQYLHVYRRWSIRDICQWGGWSTEFSSLTIVKYLISWNDSPVVQRRDFFNPRRPLQLKCPYCGRACNCA
ncbi:hypothetical protein K438DRAFT_1606316, partial [Mycena galopus ATCC 62051]